MEDKVNEKVQPPREKAEKVTVQEEKMQAKKLTEEQQQQSLRAEESGLEGNWANYVRVHKSENRICQLFTFLTASFGKQRVGLCNNRGVNLRLV